MGRAYKTKNRHHYHHHYYYHSPYALYASFKPVDLVFSQAYRVISPISLVSRA